MSAGKGRSSYSKHPIQLWRSNVNDYGTLEQGWVVTPALLPHTQMAALPRVLYETLAHPRGTENTFARRMVLASRFRGSSLRLPLSGMVYCEPYGEKITTPPGLNRKAS